MNERLLLAAHGLTETEADELLATEIPTVDLSVHGRRELERIRRQLAHRPCPCHVTADGEPVAVRVPLEARA